MLGDVVTVVRVSICVIYVTIPGPGPGLPPNSLWTLSQYVTLTHCKILDSMILFLLQHQYSIVLHYLSCLKIPVFFVFFSKKLRCVIESFVLLLENWLWIVQVQWLNNYPDLISTQDITHYTKYKFLQKQFIKICSFCLLQIVQLCLI